MMTIAMAIASVAIAGSDTEANAGLTPSTSLDDANGRQIIEAVAKQKMAFPAVFERQSMILVDAEGNRETRKLRRYSQIHPDGSGHYLLLLDSPSDVAGVALLASRNSTGQIKRQLYLPALGGQIIETGLTLPVANKVSTKSQAKSQAKSRADGQIKGQIKEQTNSKAKNQRDGLSQTGHLSPVLGSDFTIEDLSGENLQHYRYKRQRDRSIEGIEYYQVAVYNQADNPLTAVAVKRHYVQKNHLVITRTDYFNEFGELSKQRSAHDLQPVSPSIWQPNMQFLNNIKAAHQSIIKTEERIFSADYLPADVFTTAWLLANHPPLLPAAPDPEILLESQATPTHDAIPESSNVNERRS